MLSNRSHKKSCSELSTGSRLDSDGDPGLLVGHPILSAASNVPKGIPEIAPFVQGGCEIGGEGTEAVGRKGSTRFFERMLGVGGLLFDLDVMGRLGRALDSSLGRADPNPTRAEVYRPRSFIDGRVRVAKGRSDR